MVDFFGDKRVPALGSNKGVKATPIASRREVRIIFLGLLATLAILVLRPWGGAQVAPAPTVPPVAVLSAMRTPALSALPALPASAAIAAQQPAIAEMLAAGHQPSLLTGIDAGVLAWGESLTRRDREQPPLPQRVSADDLGRRLVGAGSPLLVGGRLDDLIPAAAEDGSASGLRWLSLELAEGRYAVALAADDGFDMVLNERVDILGRYLGQIEVDGQDMPLIVARAVSVSRGAVAVIPEGMREFHGALRLPDDIYRGVDDELPLIETRAYYYTVGQVKAEASIPEVYTGAIDGNLVANDIHQRPDEYRGRAGTVRGVVYHAWEDPQIVADQPFDVGRVGRILIYKRDVGPITENGVTQVKSVLRLFELAVVGDQPLPKVGDYIEATGRFVKWRAIKVDRTRREDPLYGSTGGSGKAYSMFFVVPSYQMKVVERVDWMPVQILISVLAGVACIGVLFYLHRDRGAERRMRDSVLQLRQTRRKAGPHGQRGPAPSDGAAPPGNIPPPPAP